MKKLKEMHNVDEASLKKPKKCLSSYMIFVREVRHKVTQEFPDMNALDVMKEVGRRWQTILPEDKVKFQAMADQDKERFKRENQQYMKELEKLDLKMKKLDNDPGEPEPSKNEDPPEVELVNPDSKRKTRREENMPK